MNEKRTDGEPGENEQTTPSHEQQAEEQAQAESENGYNDPIGGLPIA